MQHVIPVDLAKFPQGWHSEILASPKSGVDSCYVICSRVEPGANGPKLHTHPADQFYYVMAGTMRVQLGTEEFSVGPDTLVFIPEGTPHCNGGHGCMRSCLSSDDGRTEGGSIHEQPCTET
jgi:quercetin dioxygenase-like cupin family protein